jgi:hypothetical protein
LKWLADMIAFKLVKNIINFPAFGDANMTTVMNYVTDAVPTVEGNETFDKIFLFYD